jgi:hypothetical protein
MTDADDANDAWKQFLARLAGKYAGVEGPDAHSAAASGGVQGDTGSPSKLKKLKALRETLQKQIRADHEKHRPPSVVAAAYVIDTYIDRLESPVNQPTSASADTLAELIEKL